MKALQQYHMQQETVSDDHVTVTKLYFKNGDSVSAGDTVVDIETSKAVVEIDTDADGIIQYACQAGGRIKTGELVFTVYDTIAAEDVDNRSGERAGGNQPERGHSHPIEPVRKVQRSAMTGETAGGEPLFSNKASERIRQIDLPESRFQGRDFVTLEDVEALLATTGAVAETPSRTVPGPDAGMQDGRVTLKPISPSKRTEIQYLSGVQAAGLNSAIHVHVDVGNLFAFTGDYFEVFKESMLPLAVYEVSRLLKKYKEFNAFYSNGQIAYYEDIHIGIAVDIDDGLRVLTIPRADTLTPREIETTLNDRVTLYLDRQLKPEHISGSTFTITDLSSQQVSFFQPLINKDQSAILGISGVDEKLDRCTLTLVFDHRVTEGMRASKFINALKERLESYRMPPDRDGGMVVRESGAERTHSEETVPLSPAPTCGGCLKTLAEDRKLAGPGFIKIVDAEGREAMLCRDCMMGF